MTQEEDSGAPAAAITTRWAELVTALVIVALGLIVVYDSHRVGIGWADDGPRSGYFPNIVGWMLTASGAWIAGSTIAHWRKLGWRVFVTRADLKPVLAMLLPTIAYVVLIWLIGIYVASAVYIAGFMRLQGKYNWLPTALVSIGVPAVLFVLFEIWFLVPLPK
jgi:putative tricarboxylic transport membrane protein